MFLKFYPADVPVSVLVQHSFIMLQSTLMRVQELQADGSLTLSDHDRSALNDLIALLQRALDDALRFQKAFVN